MNKKFTLGLVLAVIAAMTFSSFASAAVWTDQYIYYASDTVFISGNEMQPGETVSVDIFFPDGSPAQHNEVVANDAGDFSDTYVIPAEAPAGDYALVATGQASGNVFNTVFDPPAAHIAVTASPADAIGGTFDISTVNNGGHPVTNLGKSTPYSDGADPVSAYSITNIQTSVHGCTYTGNQTLTGTLGADKTTTTVTLQYSCPSADQTPPVLTLPANITADATSSAGAVVTFVATANDAVDGDVDVACTPASGSTFALGTTTVNCSATDAAGNTARGSFTVTVRDATAPVISYVLNPALPNGSNGWYNSDVTLTWTVTENETPSSLVKTGCVDQNITADQAATDYSCSATSDGGSAGPVTVSIKRDATVPTISAAADRSPNTNGWYKADVTVEFTCTDLGSGIPSGACPVAQVLDEEGAAVSSLAQTVTDAAGNVSAESNVVTVSIDKTAPEVSLVGGPADGGTYYFGFVPAAPTCKADDALSGLDGTCSVSGYSNAIGSHTVTGSATDKAGNKATTDPVMYEVKAWTLNGFYQPVDGSFKDGKIPASIIWNTVKGGSTVPLKFEVLADTELTDPAFIWKSWTATPVACNGGIADDIEVLATGATSLRYDTTAGQFIFNWQTPKKPGACYQLTLTTQDGSSLGAFFKLK